jgi:hypothetical protein
MAMRRAIVVGLLALVLAAPVAAQDEGRKVTMVAPLTPKLRAIARAYYLNHPADNTVSDYPDREKLLAAVDALGGAFADLDDDGRPEVFLRENGSILTGCGSSGCGVNVLKKYGRTWRSLGGFMDKSNEFFIMPQKKGGFHLLKTYEDPHYDEVYVKWDGKQFIDDDEANNFRDLSGR